MTLPQAAAQKQPEADLARTYDAVVVGSGAAGGMAAHVLTVARPRGAAAGSGQEARHRERAEVDGVALRPSAARRDAATPSTPSASTSTRSASRPTRRTRPATKVYSYVQGWGGSDYSKNIVVDEKDHPYTGTSYAWVRARAASAARPTSGAASPSASRTTTSRRRATTATARTGRSPTPTSRPTTTRWTSTSASPGSTENLPHLPDGLPAAHAPRPRPR